MFSHDTELSLLAVVDLVNSAPECGGHGAHARRRRRCGVRRPAPHLRSRPRATSTTSTRYTASASRLRTVFGVDDPEAVAARVNALLAEAPVRPRLTNHDDYGWHVHYFAPGATLAEHVAVDGGMALAHVVSLGRDRAAARLRGTRLRRRARSTCRATGRSATATLARAATASTSPPTASASGSSTRSKGLEWRRSRSSGTPHLGVDEAWAGSPTGSGTAAFIPLTTVRLDRRHPRRRRREVRGAHRPRPAPLRRPDGGHLLAAAGRRRPGVCRIDKRGRSCSAGPCSR